MRKSLSQLATYQALQAHANDLQSKSLRELFMQDPNRFESFSQQFNQLLLDYSKNRITEKSIDLFVALLNECEVQHWQEKMFAGETINLTEHRAVQHVALRDFDKSTSTWAKKQSAVLQHIEKFVDEIYSRKITDIVNIGIGGSHLGPMFVCDALQKFAKPGLNIHFVANVDAHEVNHVLKQIKPETSLFIITSKSFTTQETLVNAETAKQWFVKHSKPNTDIANHFVAVSANIEKAEAFGISVQNVFPMWDEVGGRYSLWSAVGLSIALLIGMPNFKKLLQGASSMDEHFKTCQPKENIPMLLACLEIWNQHFFGTNTNAVLPYDTRLRYLPAYLQQLVMESNGKFVDREGEVLEVPSSPVVFGDVGTNAQHSFFQLLHQGTQSICCDFIGVVQPEHDNRAQHNILLANLIGQTQALMLGQTIQEAQEQGDAKNAPHKYFPGNRVSNTILLTELTPNALGVLLAMYEHKVFVQGIILNINSFDQMGVELGKKLANNILNKIENDNVELDQDASTNALIKFYKQNS